MIKGIPKGFIPQQNNPQQETSLRVDHRNPKILAAARMYEQQFLQEMTNAMRQSVPKSDLVKESMGEKIFTDQLYDKYVEQWSNVGGVGLADLIYDQIVERFAPQQKMKPIEKPQGPVPLEQGKTFQLKNQSQDPHGAMIFQIMPQKYSDKTEILMPWKGELMAVQNLDDGQRVAFVKHENGLNSTFLFRGQLNTQKKVFGPGESIAQLSSISPGFTWKLT